MSIKYRSMFRFVTPTDNPMIKSLNGSIKAEIARDYQLNEEEIVELFLNDYIPLFKRNKLTDQLQS